MKRRRRHEENLLHEMQVRQREAAEEVAALEIKQKEDASREKLEQVNAKKLFQKELSIKARAWREDRLLDWSETGKQLIYHHRQSLANVKNGWTNVDPYGNQIRSGWHDVDRPYFVKTVLLPSFESWLIKKYNVNATSEITAFPGSGLMSPMTGMIDMIARWSVDEIEKAIKGVSPK